MSQRLLVQFLHPGAEHRSDRLTMEWNRQAHRRKFLIQDGAARREGAGYTGELAFWGEWEPPSRVELITNPVRGGPTCLHRPFYSAWTTEEWRQNTDPCVFDGFRYTCCQQHFKGQPSTLQKLGPGSLILFGACVGGAFALDTVMVIRDDGIEHDRVTYRDLRGRIPKGYFEVTMEPWYSDPDAFAPCRLYEGASADSPYRGTFSFFPALPWSQGLRGFARPSIELPGMISPSQTQGRKFTTLTEAQAVSAWREVVRQVEVAGLWVGTHASFPPKARAL
jgi:hypothetical protein